MRRAPALPVAVVFAVAALVFWACVGAPATPTAPPTPQPPPTAAATAAATPAATPAPTTAPSPAPTANAGPVAVGTLTDVRLATIQIEGTGTFVDPKVGQMNNAAGSGSGFFIDPSGLALTNNHVVTGAAFLKVWIGGEQGRVHNARVLGTSECSDLALIKVDVDGTVPYLEWYTGKIEPGLEVYAAGFPLGDPQYTLKKGIVSKARANGDTDWASIDYVIEHDAATLPGNSGGPLVTGDGKVVGVNYASDQAGERFSISRDEVKRVQPDLQAERSVTSIGVNGVAINDAEAGISGIWVSSVQSGDAADTVGVKAGDIITRLEGLVLSTDGTMGDYCRVLRSHSPGAPLSIQVLRYSTGQVLEGLLNGSRALAPVLALNTDPDATPVPEPTPGSEPTAAPGPSGSPAPPVDDYPSYQVVIDQSGSISTEVPSAWTDISAPGVATASRSASGSTPRQTSRSGSRAGTRPGSSSAPRRSCRPRGWTCSSRRHRRRPSRTAR